MSSFHPLTFVLSLSLSLSLELRRPFRSPSMALCQPGHDCCLYCVVHCRTHSVSGLSETGVDGIIQRTKLQAGESRRAEVYTSSISLPLLRRLHICTSQMPNRTLCTNRRFFLCPPSSLLPSHQLHLLIHTL